MWVLRAHAGPMLASRGLGLGRELGSQVISDVSAAQRKVKGF